MTDKIKEATLQEMSDIGQEIEMNIKELAEQAGFFPSDNFDHTNWHAAGFSKDFELFAELVAAAEREACAKVCEKLGEAYVDNYAVRSAYDCAEVIRGRQA